MLEGQYIHQYVLPSLSVSGGTISLFSVILNCFSGEVVLQESFLAPKHQFSCLIRRGKERKDNSEENYNGGRDSLPVEVLPTEDVAVPEEALLVELLVTVVTPHALDVPGLVQHRQQEPRQDRLPAAVAAGESHDGELERRL